MIPNLAAALAGRKKFVDEVSEISDSVGTGRGLSDGIRASGMAAADTLACLRGPHRARSVSSRRIAFFRAHVL